MNKRCLNCDRSLSDERFCPDCGQATKLKQITFRETVGDFLGSMLSLEGSFPKTIVALCTRPATLFRDYLAGKRMNYYKPVAFFIVTTAIYLLVSSAIGFDPLRGTRIQLTHEDQVVAQETTARAAIFMVSHINHIMLLLVLSIGFWSRIFFRKRYNLAEYVAVGFFVTSIYTLFGTITMFFTHWFHTGFKFLNFLFLIIYITLVYPPFVQRQTVWNYFKAWTMACVTLLFYILLGFGFSFLWVSLV